MSEKCNCGCLFSWLSGFFAMPALVHLIRIVGGWDVAMKGEPVSMKTSWIILAISGLLSFVCAMISCKKHKASTPSSCGC